MLLIWLFISDCCSFILQCDSPLHWTFFAAQARGEGGRPGRKWIYVPISSRAPCPDPQRISNTMFYKLMILEVGQGYPPLRRRRHTSSVKSKVFWSKKKPLYDWRLLTPPVFESNPSYRYAPAFRGVHEDIHLIRLRVESFRLPIICTASFIYLSSLVNKWT